MGIQKKTKADILNKPAHRIRETRAASPLKKNHGSYEPSDADKAAHKLEQLLVEEELRLYLAKK